MLKVKQIAAMFSAMVLALSNVSADTIKPNGCKGPDLCNSFPIYDGCGWHFEIGLLAEQMRISNTSIAVINSSGTDTISSPGDINSFVNINFDVTAGIRLGVGKYFNHDDWMVNTEFEWMSSTGSKSIDLANSTGWLVPTGMGEWFDLGYAPSDYHFQNLDASLKVDYFLLDVFLSRGSYFSGKFTYEPFAGIKAAWLGYSMSQAYFQLGPDNDVNGEIDSTQSALRKVQTDFWGVGPMIGMNGNYHVTAGWSFFSSTNFALLLGETSVVDRHGLVVTETLPTGAKTSGNFQVLCPTLRNIIGLQYDRDIFCDKQHYTIRFGFDARYYFNQYPVVNLFGNGYDNTGSYGTADDLYTVPTLVDNNSWGMVGFLLDFGWDY
jgi:hypothetical protein